MSFPRCFVLSVVWLAAGGSVLIHCSNNTAVAQSADVILQSLQPKPRPRTRSIVRRDRIDVEDKTFLGGLHTRGIRIEQTAQRAKLAEIIKKDELPKIDLTINFDYDSDTIRPSSIPTMVELGKALTSPSMNLARILLNGHTDGAGGDRYNLTLSEKRAQAVKTYLVTHFAIRDDKLMAIGFGKEQLKNVADPLAAENRRVEIVNIETK